MVISILLGMALARAQVPGPVERPVLLVVSERRPTDGELALLGKIQRKADVPTAGVKGLRVLGDGEAGLILTLVPPPGGAGSLQARKLDLLTRIARGERVNLGDLSPQDRAGVYARLAFAAAKPLPDSTPLMGTLERSVVLSGGGREIRLGGNAYLLGGEDRFESDLDAGQEWPTANVASQRYVPEGAEPIPTRDGLYSVSTRFLSRIPRLATRRKLNELAVKLLFTEAEAEEETMKAALTNLNANTRSGASDEGRRIADLSEAARKDLARDLLADPGRYGFSSKADAEAWFKGASIARVVVTGGLSVPRRSNDLRGRVGIGW